MWLIWYKNTDTTGNFCIIEKTEQYEACPRVWVGPGRGWWCCAGGLVCMVGTKTHGAQALLGCWGGAPAAHGKDQLGSSVVTGQGEGRAQGLCPPGPTLVP